jgi:hypothetical protein
MTCLHCTEINLLSSTLQPFLQFTTSEFHVCAARKLDGKPEASKRLVQVDPGAGSCMSMASGVLEI